MYGNILLYIILLNYLFPVSHCLASLTQGVSGDSENKVDPIWKNKVYCACEKLVYDPSLYLTVDNLTGIISYL